MTRYDCSKTMDYVHEQKRMCDAVQENGCFSCPLHGVGASCYNIRFIGQKHIDIVQEWSDGHPAKTRKEVFSEMFPKADVRFIGVNNACFGYLIGKKCGDARGGEVGCEGCWDRPYNGEFEEAREE